MLEISGDPGDLWDLGDLWRSWRPLEILETSGDPGDLWGSLEIAGDRITGTTQHYPVVPGLRLLGGKT
eukprot:963703-Amorphochlora_amoeboformis.AAC.1